MDTSTDIPLDLTEEKTSFFRQLDWSAFWTAFVVSFGVYFYTMAPTVGLEDGGELAVAGDYLGVRAFFAGDGIALVAGILPMLVVGRWLPVPIWWTAGSALLALGLFYAMSFLVLRLSYGIIYRPLVDSLNRRYRVLPTRLDDFSAEVRCAELRPPSLVVFWGVVRTNVLALDHVWLDPRDQRHVHTGEAVVRIHVVAAILGKTLLVQDADQPIHGLARSDFD